ncbi:hypothetical protein P9112_004557 [Eukaryota sp. TZLM1-RC]
MSNFDQSPAIQAAYDEFVSFVSSVEPNTSIEPLDMALKPTRSFSNSPGSMQSQNAPSVVSTRSLSVQTLRQDTVSQPIQCNLNSQNEPKAVQTVSEVEDYSTWGVFE